MKYTSYAPYVSYTRKPKIYLSGPMAGLDWDKVIKNFEKFETIFTELGFDVVNPCKINHRDTNNRELTLKEDFTYLRRCEFIFMMPGWRDAKGCNAEWGYALALDSDITVLESEDVNSLNNF